MPSSIRTLSIARRSLLLGLGAAGLTGIVGIPVARALTASEDVVEQARLTMLRLLDSPEFKELRGFIERARGVVIFPEVYKGGFLLGAEGGTGVLLVRGADKTWSSPAFYTLAAGSLGLQIGGQISEVVLTVMNDEALSAILSNNFKMGVDASIAVGPVGKGIEASTTTALKEDIYAFSKTKGLFGGGSLEGAGLIERESLNSEYYGQAVAVRDVVLERRFHNRHANGLRSVLP